MKQKKTIKKGSSIWIAIVRIGVFDRPHIVTATGYNEFQAMQSVVNTVGPCEIRSLVRTKSCLPLGGKSK